MPLLKSEEHHGFCCKFYDAGVVKVGSTAAARFTFRPEPNKDFGEQLLSELVKQKAKGRQLELPAAARQMHSAGAAADAGQQQPSEQLESEQQPSEQPLSKQPPSKQPPRPPATAQSEQAAQAAKQAVAQKAELESGVLFGSVRRQPAPVRDDEIRCGLHPAVLESDLGVAWEPGRGGRAEAERAEASRAAQAQYVEKQRAAIAARKESAKRAREEPVHRHAGVHACALQRGL